MYQLTNQQEKLLSDLQSDAFKYFIDEVNEDNGLVVDCTKGGWPSSIAAVGMALSVYPVGVEHHFISREEAIERTLKKLRFFATSEQSESPNALTIEGIERVFFDYVARGVPDGPDDGTLAPWAVARGVPARLTFCRGGNIVPAALIGG
jgi:hypothetical protein